MNKELKSFFWFRFPVYSYAAVILLYSALKDPVPKKYQWIPHLDKWLHAAEYALLGYLVIRMIKSIESHFSNKKFIFLSISYSTVYGALMELYQRFIPYRSADIIDLTVDFIGATIGTLIYFKIFMKRPD